MFNSELSLIHQGSNVILSRQCPFCGKVTKKSLDAKVFYDGMVKLDAGYLIQNAFHDVDASTRELIQTGICDKCWEKNF